MNKRLEQFLAAENISQSQFAERIGVTRASVSHILAGRNKPGFDFIHDTLAHFPALSAEWLMLGVGKMYKSPAQSTDAGSEKTVFNASSTRPQTFTDQDLNVITEGSDPSDASRTLSDNKEDEESMLPFSEILSNGVDNTTQTISLHDKNIKTSDTTIPPQSGSGADCKKRIIRVILMYDDGTFTEME